MPIDARACETELRSTNPAPRSTVDSEPLDGTLSMLAPALPAEEELAGKPGRLEGEPRESEWMVGGSRLAVARSGP